MNWAAHFLFRINTETIVADESLIGKLHLAIFVRKENSSKRSAGGGPLGVLSG